MAAVVVKDEGFVNVDDEPASPPNLSRDASPRKMIVKVGRRKRRRENENKPDPAALQHTYVMKLFDRSVDLAQFDEEAPLYPICRAWLRNQPLYRDNTTRDDRMSGDSSDDEWDDNAFMEDDVPRDIRKLPPQLPLDPYQARFPPPVKCDESLNIYRDLESEGRQPEDLLLGHMARWKETRIRWRDHSRENEGRYAHSLNILRTMYERQMKDS